MKFAPAFTLLWSSASVLLSLAVVDAEKKCETNVEKYKMSAEGYYIQGAHSVYPDVDEDSPYRSRVVDARWSSTLSYQTGENKICTGPYCSDACKESPGCPTFLNVKSCASLRFCYDEEEGEDVWMMPDLESLNNCDFSAATKICNKKEGQGETCCEYRVEHEDLMDYYYFTSKNSCEAGLRLAVETADFYDVVDQCYDKGLISTRVRECNCLFDPDISGSPSTLSEPCHSLFAAGCIEGGPGLDADCCEDKTCVNKIFDVGTKEGRKFEKKRQKECNNWIPGKCDAAGDEDLEKFDCCENTCKSCGYNKNPYATWESCEYDDGSLQCGNVEKFGDPYTCDFDKCPKKSKWHPKGKKYKKWQKYVGSCPKK